MPRRPARPRGRSSLRTWWSGDVDVDYVEQRRLHDTRRRIESRGRDGWHGAERVPVTTIDGAAWRFRERVPGERSQGGTDAPEEEVWNALGGRHTRLHGQERL